jgi:hypothetical protein
LNVYYELIYRHLKVLLVCFIFSVIGLNNTQNTIRIFLLLKFVFTTDRSLFITKSRSEQQIDVEKQQKMDQKIRSYSHLIKT